MIQNKQMKLFYVFKKKEKKYFSVSVCVWINIKKWLIKLELTGVGFFYSIAGNVWLGWVESIKKIWEKQFFFSLNEKLFP